MTELSAACLLTSTAIAEAVSVTPYDAKPNTVALPPLLVASPASPRFKAWRQPFRALRRCSRVRSGSARYRNGQPILRLYVRRSPPVGQDHPTRAASARMGPTNGMAR